MLASRTIAGFFSAIFKRLATESFRRGEKKEKGDKKDKKEKGDKKDKKDKKKK